MPELISHWNSYDGLNPRAVYAMLKLHMDVFILEQSCPFEETDSKDLTASHLRILHEVKSAAYLRVLPPSINMRLHPANGKAA